MIQNHFVYYYFIMLILHYLMLNINYHKITDKSIKRLIYRRYTKRYCLNNGTVHIFYVTFYGKTVTWLAPLMTSDVTFPMTLKNF